MMSRTPKLAAVAVLAAFSGLALQVQAQETVELDEVKVTAGRVEQELMDVNMSVSVITQEEIRRSSARNVGELLEDIPGVRINNDGGQGMKRIKIRGEDVNFLADPLPDVLHRCLCIVFIQEFMSVILV